MKRTISALLLALFASNAPAADRSKLVPLFVNGTNSIQIFLEPASIRPEGDHLELRVHMLFTPSRTDAYDVNGIYHEFGEPVSKVVDTVQVSCEDQQFETLQSQFYNIDDEVIWTLDHEGSQKMLADEQSVSGLVYNVICQRRIMNRQST